MDAGQELGRVLEAPEPCQKLTVWLLGRGEAGEGRAGAGERSPA